MGRGWNAQRLRWSGSLVVGVGLVALVLEACGDESQPGPGGSGGSNNAGDAGEPTSGTGASPSGGSSTGATGGTAGDGGEPQGGSSTGGAPIGGEGGMGEGGEAGDTSGAGGMMGAGAGGIAGSMAGGGSGGAAGGGSGGLAGGGMAGKGGMAGGGGMAGAGNVGGAGGNGGFTSGGIGGRSGAGGMDGGRAGMSGDGGMAGTSGSSCHPVINEVSVAGTNGAADEYVEIFNPCNRPIDLVGGRLVYRSGNGDTDLVLVNFQASLVIPSNGYVLFAGEGFVGVSDGVYNAPTGRLAAAAGGVALRDADASIIDSVGYGTATNAYVETSAVPAPPSGQSIARTPNGTDTNNNLQDFVVGVRSPRAVNP